MSACLNPPPRQYCSFVPFVNSRPVSQTQLAVKSDDGCVLALVRSLANPCDRFVSFRSLVRAFRFVRSCVSLGRQGVIAVVVRETSNRDVHRDVSQRRPKGRPPERAKHA